MKTYIILLLISFISCKNVDREKSKIEILKDSTKIEQKSNLKIIVKNTKPITSSDEFKNIQKVKVIKENKKS